MVSAVSVVPVALAVLVELVVQGPKLAALVAWALQVARAVPVVRSQLLKPHRSPSVVVAKVQLAVLVLLVILVLMVHPVLLVHQVLRVQPLAPSA